jgi:hypothetical protein
MKLSERLNKHNECGDYVDQARDLECRLEYAIRLIELMGAEIIEWTPRRKKCQANKDLAEHLSYLRGD